MGERVPEEFMDVWGGREITAVREKMHSSMPPQRAKIKRGFNLCTSIYIFRFFSLGIEMRVVRDYYYSLSDGCVAHSPKGS